MSDNDLAYFGYSDGNYLSTCASCCEGFLGGKRSIRCKPCAIRASKVAERCPICSKGFLIHLQGSTKMDAGGRIVTIPLRYSTCTYCHTEQTNPEQSKENAENFKKATNDQTLC